jgi:hypothetical protein
MQTDGVTISLDVLLDELRTSLAASKMGPAPQLELSDEFVAGARVAVHGTLGKIAFRIARETGLDREELFKAIGLDITPFEGLLDTMAIRQQGMDDPDNVMP